MCPHRGEPRLPFHVQLALSRRAAELNASGLTFGQVAAELGVSYTSARRLVHWIADSEATGSLTRRYRLPMRWSRAWDQERFDHLVADRAKVAEAMQAQEALDAAERTQRAAAGATRNVEKARRDEAAEWVTGGSDPAKVPAWLLEALMTESLTGLKDLPPGPGTPSPP